jgi:4-hydroxybenzoate polyprenyltransferase
LNSFFDQLREKLLYSNIIIAFAAAFLTAEYFWINELELDRNYILFVFYLTLAHYNLHRIAALHLDNNLPFGERISAIQRNYYLQLLLAIISTLVAVFLFFYHAYYRCELLYAAFGLGILYSLPILGIRIRDFRLSKVPIVALTWVLITTIIPAQFRSNELTTGWLLSIEQFLFITALTIPFDIRDIQRDQNLGVKTVAGVFGVNKTKKISAYILLLCQGAVLLQFISGESPRIITLSKIIFYVCTFVIIYLGVKKGRKDVFYIGVLDSLIIIKGVLVYLVLNYFSP